MPLFKAWDSQRSIRKSVFANSIEEFTTKSVHKLGLKGPARVFLEDDGTEIDDEDCFMALKEGTILIVGSEWQGASNRSENSTVTTPIDPHKYITEIQDTPEIQEEVNAEGEGSGESTSNAFVALTTMEHKNAKMKGLKVYDKKDIETTKSDMEKRRKEFWNEKAEQLCCGEKTKKFDKTILYGMVEVSWTLRKTGILETEARKLQHQEDVLFNREHSASSGKRKLGSQKKETLPKNIERVSIAHLQVESLDSDLVEARSRYGVSSDKTERARCQRESQEKTILFDGAYSELKRAQDALYKSMVQKKKEIEDALKEKEKE